jgi:hypothetical protein
MAQGQWDGSVIGTVYLVALRGRTGARVSAEAAAPEGFVGEASGEGEPGRHCFSWRPSYT